MSKIISSFGSIGGLGNSTPLSGSLSFSDGWGVGPIFSWYNSLTNRRAKTIQTLQIRKDSTGLVPHRFVILHMSDMQVHRFDRRPDRGPSTNTRAADLLSNQAVASEDTYMLNVPLPEVEERSECEIELFLDGQVDLLAVLAACYAISIDDSARQYTFLRHNCFFFSWTILMVVSRHHLPYEAPSYDSIILRFESQLDRLTEFIVDEAISLFREMVIDTVTVFRKRLGPLATGKGVSRRVRMAWSLPEGGFRFIWRQAFALRLHFGLRDQLTKMVKAELSRTVSLVYKPTLSTHMSRDLLDTHLWIDEAQEKVKSSLEKEIMKILWASIVEAISSGIGDTNPQQFAEQLADPRSRMSIIGWDATQLCAVWSAALHGGLKAAKEIEQNLEGLSHVDAFDRVWFTAGKGALKHARTFVQETSEFEKTKKPQRDDMWNANFEVWDECWDKAHKVVQPRSIQTVNRVVEELLATGTGIMIQDIKESKVRTVQTRTSKVRHSKLKHVSLILWI